MAKEPERQSRQTRRARRDHAAAALEALHFAVTSLERAQYHLGAIGIPTQALTAAQDAAGKLAKAHALTRLVVDRLP
jgi:hypothetical protein